MNGRCLGGATRAKSSHRSGVVVRSAHKQQLSKLRLALEQAQPEDSWQAKQSQIVKQKLEQLQNKWEADTDADAQPLSASSGQTESTRVRRLRNAVEYDFTAADDEYEDDDDTDASSSKSRSIPREMKYFDTASINVKAGDGGTGCCAFRREKFVSHGGPSGGNGGDGGSVWAVADDGMSSLSSFRNKVHWKAASGVNGSGKDMHGANASDEYIKVPLGTIIRSKNAADFDAPLAELLNHGDKALLVQGGRGGRGNAAFKSAKNKAPIIAEDGEEGQEMWLELELKVVADVGIIGVPNAGKSTLLSVISSAKPKIANYPFTTLVPNLGVCELDYRTTVFADVPGILEGAHTGLGLGHEFLRHCSRARVLVHVVDGTSADPLYDYRAIRAELAMFSPVLARKPQIVAYNKIDVPDSADYVDDVLEMLRDEFGVDPDAVVPISAVSGEGVQRLVRQVHKVLDELPPVEAVLETNALNQQEKAKSNTDLARIGEFEIEAELAESRTWFVYGDALERFAQMTNWDYFEAVLRFQRVLEACGLCATLRKKGVMEGDTVVIGEVQFEWSDDQSDGALYENWIDDINARGKVGKGSARWPHISG